MNFNITRRQFLQYCTASAAALGLSQTDLLRLEQALAAQTQCESPTPSVVWLSAQACSGCPVTLLNRVVKVTGGYYDADMINALYSTLAPFPQDSVLQGDPNDLGLPLNIVNDAGDLLVGDGVGALVPAITPRYLTWADGAAGVGLLPNPNPFPGGYITLEWNATVMAAAGDIPVAHLNSIVNGGGYAGLFVLVVDGSVPTGGLANSKEKMCLVFDNYEANPLTGANAPGLGPVTAADALRWMAPKAAAVISVGTCASYGGIPAGAGNKTGARSVQQFFTEEGISTPVINVPGCPPHPDWIVYPVAYVIANSLALPALDDKGRPLAVYSGSRGNEFDTFCFDCPNLSTLGTPQAAQELGDSGCLGGLGCKGPYTVGDCPIRQKNTADDGTLMNWCVGAQGAASLPSTHVGSGIGEGRHPCQGCIEPGFPDWASLTVSGDRTRKNVKGFYNN